MGVNDRIILDQVLDQQNQSLGPTLDPAAYFEVFAASQVLKDFDLSYDEIESGIVAGGGDGGIDGFYAFINGEILQEDTEIEGIRKVIQVDVFLLQAKTSGGFSEMAMDRFAAATEDLFDLSKPLPSLKSVYNEGLIEAAGRFREAYKKLASKFPLLKIHYYYATKGDQVHPNVQRKVDKIETVVKKFFSSSEFLFEFLGASALLDLARRTPTTVYELKLAENPISSAGDVAFICLVSLKSLFAFITDADGNVIRHIFEANVRDYQGRTQVNEQIQDTLQHPGKEDFWWLNNGITVLATRATQSGKSLTVENPEIVNGLQTSSEISTFFRESNTQNESRNILVRVIVPNAAESRDRVIKATNSQTTIPPASLRATDRIHRDIEQYLKPFGLFYDRRKNLYRNEGKPIGQIISIPQMAQAVMAIVLQRPDTARARPSSLIKNEKQYDLLFTPDYPIEVYRACAQSMKEVVRFLSQHPDKIPTAERNDLKYYVAMAACDEALKKPRPSAADVASLAGASLDDTILESCLQLVRTHYHALGGTDQTAKGPALLEAIKQVISARYPLGEGSEQAKGASGD